MELKLQLGFIHTTRSCDSRERKAFTMMTTSSVWGTNA